MTIRAETQTTSLGRYRIVKRLANGGMADVLLARTDGIEGFERHIVIKRIHAALLDEPRYVKMFLDEARLAASLHHHNIVQVNDIGQDAGEYFFAMEYVHGEDARSLLVEASKRGQQIPIEHVITIVTAAAAGLHHAHEQRAADRTPLGIVHRDVSPANILVGFDGSVKVADFGIALAAHRAEHTQSGVLKGKVAYMSPEQCKSERVDRRSDVFSLGVCLYELVTVHPCFAADNDFQTMSAIVAGKITKPSHLTKAVDLALEQIILKALAVNPVDRFQTTDDLRIALEDYADAAGLRCSTTALADYMREQFGQRELPWQGAGEAIADDDDLEISLVATAEDSQTIVVDEDDLAIPMASHRPIKATLPLRPVKAVIVAKRAVVPDIEPEPLPPPPPPPAPAAPVPQPLRVPGAADKHSRRWWLAAVVITLVVATLGLLLVLGSDKPRPAQNRVPSASPARRAPLAPLPAPSFTAPEAAPAAAVEPAPTKKQPVRRAKAKATAEPKWDPDALFPK